MNEIDTINTDLKKIGNVAENVEFDNNSGKYYYTVGLSYSRFQRGMTLHKVLAGKSKEDAEKERGYLQKAMINWHNFAALRKRKTH